MRLFLYLLIQLTVVMSLCCVKKKSAIATAQLDAANETGSGKTNVSCVLMANKERPRDLCWQSAATAGPSVDQLQKACRDDGGLFRSGVFCENIKDRAMCDKTLLNSQVVTFYTADTWSNEMASADCKGKFTPGVYEPLFRASCSSGDNEINLCIDYVDMVATGHAILQADCIGGWRDGQLCQPPAGTLGCRAQHNELRGWQTMWYLSRSHIEDVCTGGVIVKS